VFAALKVQEAERQHANTAQTKQMKVCHWFFSGGDQIRQVTS